MNDMTKLGASALSTAELDCLRQLAEGREPALIATDLGCSVGDVEHLLDGAADKLGARTRLQAVVRATRLDLLAAPSILRQS